jgi:hypothetical protein
VNNEVEEAWRKELIRFRNEFGTSKVIFTQIKKSSGGSPNHGRWAGDGEYSINLETDLNESSYLSSNHWKKVLRYEKNNDPQYELFNKNWDVFRTNPNVQFDYFKSFSQTNRGASIKVERY